jgi:hypothetical protein
MLCVVATIAFLPIVAKAQDKPSACGEMDKSLPAELSGWTTKSDLEAATGAAGLGKAELTAGRAATVTLHRTPDISYVAQPAKPGGSVSYGGLLRVTVKTAGTYKVGLGSGAWIDLVKDKKLVISTAHGHGPDCSTIRKVVDFPLQPGRYVLQISANADPEIAVMVWSSP